MLRLIKSGLWNSYVLDQYTGQTLDEIRHEMFAMMPTDAGIVFMPDDLGVLRDEHMQSIIAEQLHIGAELLCINPIVSMIHNKSGLMSWVVAGNADFMPLIFADKLCLQNLPYLFYGELSSLLALATEHRHWQIVVELMRRGAKYLPHERSALYHLAIVGNIELMQDLLDNGADINQGYWAGYAAIHGAIAGGQLACVQYLVANLAIIGDRFVGCDIVDFAKMHNSSAICEYLQQRLYTQQLAEGFCVLKF